MKLWSWQIQDLLSCETSLCSCNRAASLSKWPILRSLTNSDVCWQLCFASSLCYFEAFVSAAFAVWADLSLFLIVPYTVARGNRERRRKKQLLMSLISSGKKTMMLVLSISGIIHVKSLVTFFSTLWGSILIFLCTLCNHCLSQRTSASTSTSKAPYPLVVLSFESTPYDVDTLFFNVLSDLFPQRLT